MLSSLPLPDELLSAVVTVIAVHGAASHCVAVPCTNVEGLNTTGLYADELTAAVDDPAAVTAAVTGVWASLFSLAATRSRRCVACSRPERSSQPQRA